MHQKPRIVIYDPNITYIYTRYKDIKRYYIYLKRKLILKVEWVEPCSFGRRKESP